MYDNPVNRYVQKVVAELSQNQWDLGRREFTNMLGGGPVREYVIPGNNSMSAFASEGTDGPQMVEKPNVSGDVPVFGRMVGGKKKPNGKTAKFLRAVGHFVKPAAPLVKKAKKALAPLAKQAITQAQLEMATGGRKPNAWIQHVKAYASQHGVSYRDAIKSAKASYTGGKKYSKEEKKELKHLTHDFKKDRVAEPRQKAKKLLAVRKEVAQKEGTTYKKMYGGSAWIQHVKAYASQHGVSYKEAMSKAKATYKR